MPRPFVAYLRVYEPLSAFDSEARARLEEALGGTPIEPHAAGYRERELWLRAQLATPPRMFPGERPDGTPTPGPVDVLRLDTAHVPEPTHGALAEGPLVCPLDLRGRSAAAMVGFLSESPVAVRNVALPADEEVVKAHASRVVAEVPGGAVHVVSSTWSVPLPWFAMVDPSQREFVQQPRDDPRRRVSWRMSMGDARHRMARAHSVVHEALGAEQGPTKILRDTDRWLEHFDPGSAVELDYGGLVELMSDEDVLGDTSAEDIEAIIDALEVGDTTEVAERYQSLQDFWTSFSNKERAN